MSIVRAARRERYTVVAQAAIDDERLSWKARGLLVYLLSKPDNWKTSYRQLMKVGPDGQASILAGLKELEDHGYLVRSNTRTEGGQLQSVSHVFETPQTVRELSTPGLSTPGKPTQSIKTEVTKTEELKTSAPPSAPEVKSRPKADRDLVWDAVVAAFFKPTTPASQRRIGKVVSEILGLCGADIEAEKIAAAVPVRCQRYRERYPNTALTPEALAKHWPQLKAEPRRNTSLEAIYG